MSEKLTRIGSLNLFGYERREHLIDKTKQFTKLYIRLAGLQVAHIHCALATLSKIDATYLESFVMLIIS